MLSQLREVGLKKALYEKLKPTGSQPPRLYGLAKVHKNNIPMRPVLSMPGSAYHQITKQVEERLSTVPECQINSSTKEISDKLNSIRLAENEELLSFDASSIYTYAPIIESINICADLLFRDSVKTPPIDKETFIQLAKIASCNVVMSAHDGYYQQIDGLAMGSSPAPHLANDWISRYDGSIKGNSKLFTCYMDDILREIKRRETDQKLAEINNLHPNLSFTIELETDGTLPFLDMQLIQKGNRLASTWYSKPTDTDLILNCHAHAPKRYKRSVVSGFVHRIFRACSTWTHFHESIQKARTILQRNQYPPSFYDPIIRQTLKDIITAKTTPTNESSETETFAQTTNDIAQTSLDENPKRAIFIQYRGKCTEGYARTLHKCNAPCTFIMTLRKLKTTLPSLKPPVEKHLRSGVVYQIECARCHAAYVG